MIITSGYIENMKIIQELLKSLDIFLTEVRSIEIH